MGLAFRAPVDTGTAEILTIAHAHGGVGRKDIALAMSQRGEIIRRAGMMKENKQARGFYNRSDNILIKCPHVQ